MSINETPEDKEIEMDVSTVVERPKAKVIGENGNVFNVLAIASRALKSAGDPQSAREMSSRVLASSSYDQALKIISEYVEMI